ncbi:hypothetical protein [Cellulomonas sp. IC4_254]|uniref:hypothetical protein n=1 Tax=Cellulomonas sp. IC4_254 TaxID=2714040 RepID=UPI0014243D9A|nr:hypothetical protein [Cellulomonas sp. IC4_254]NHT16958.1 hypothetical protein [Cellulomonas sp. IC4_254]
MSAATAWPDGPAPSAGPVDPVTFPVTPHDRDDAHPGRRRGDEVGDGPFGRAVTAFAWGAGLTALLAAADLPLVALALLLRPEPSLTWLVALAAIPAGPALSAALYAVREHYVDPRVPLARAFGRGYRLGWRDAAAVSAPVCLVAGLVAVVGAGARAAGVPAVVAGLAPGAGVLLLVVALHALALRTFFHLPLAAALQAGAYYLVARWRASLGTLALLAGAVAVAAAASDLLLVLLGGVWVWLWYRTTAGMLRDAVARFLRPTTTS